MKSVLSLQERLVILVVVAILPLSALSVWFALRETRSAVGLAQSQLKFSASLVAANQDRVVEAAQHLLAVIATVPELRAFDRGRCEKFFAGLRGRYPIYANLGIVNAEGDVVCHAGGGAVRVNVADRAYFKEAVAERRFVIGHLTRGRIHNQIVLPFATPLMDEGSDKVMGVAFATLDMGRAAAALARAELPQGGRVLVADRRGVVLLEHPSRPGAGVGRNLTHPQLVAAARQLGAGEGEGVDAAGDERLFAFAPSRQVGNEGFLAVVSIGRDKVASASLSSLRDELLVLGLTLLLGLLAAWWIGGRAIIGPAREILAAVRRLELGRLDTRVPLAEPQLRSEFGRIAAAFNLMAESLQMRQQDLEAELDRSRAAHQVLDVVLNSMREGLIAANTGGQFLMYNRAAARMFDLEGPSVAPQEWPYVHGLFLADGRTHCPPDEVPLARALRGESGQQLALYVRNARVPGGRRLQCSFQPMQAPGGVQGGLVVFADVTELTQLQDEQQRQLALLKGTQQRLLEAQRIGRIGNWELDLASGRLWWSDEVYDLFGLDKRQFAGNLDAFVVRVHPEDRPRVDEAREGVLRDGGLMDVEYRVTRPDGAVCWMHELGEARPGPQGRPGSLAGVVQDVTERKRAEHAQRASERELQDFTAMLQRSAEAAQAITGHQALEATMQEVVDQARAVVGAHQAVLSLTLQDGAPWSQAVTALSVSDEYAGRDYAISSPDGTGIYRLVLESGRPLRLTDEQLRGHPAFRGFGAHAAAHPPVHGLLALPLASRDGRRIGLLMLSDKREGEFTERDEYVALELAQLASIAIDNARLFEQIRQLNAGLESSIADRTAELSRQEKLYRTLAQQAPEVVWNVDPYGNVTFLNQAWAELVGGEPEEWLGSRWLERIHPDDMPEMQANWVQARKARTAYTGIRRILGKDGSYHTMSYRAAPVVNEQGEIVSWVGIDADITEFKSIERALRTSNQELEAFSYSVSHDLRAPLSAIGGFSRALALRLEGGADERTQHFLTRIQAGVLKMEQLIEALLSLAKVVRAPLRYEPVDLGAMARDTLEELKAQQPERAVAVVVHDDMQSQGDARLLRALMQNLVANAWKFTSNRPDAAIEVGKLLGGTVFFVRDNGVGFDMAYADKLFNAFQRLHGQDEFPGTGIGLATVRRIVARHQGRVWAESRPGAGTTFFFTISSVPPPSWLAGLGA